MIENNNNYDPQTWAQIKGLMEKLVGDTEMDFSGDDMGSLEDLLDIDLEQLALDMDIEYKTQKVSFEKCRTDAVAPSYVYPSDSGFDL